MSTTHALADSATMLRRNLRHARRYPAMTISVIFGPVLMLLLFFGVFGNTLGAGISAGTGFKGDYIDYLTPGIVLMAVTSGCMVVSVAVAVDMTEGVIARFRTMAVFRTAVLNGHVAGGVLQTAASTALVLAIAVALGFRSHDATLLDWLGAIGLLLFLIVALSWLACGLGLWSKGPESASNTPLIVQFLPFLGSAVVPPEQMPASIRWFAEYQPFTPIIETLRGLLLGTPVGNDAWTSLAWCAGLTALGYLWSRRLFARDPKHAS
ncbi:ABC transporter permease [Actinomadura parmotrematis]|nr:ABC transporter permease [Actinomadura parmotrematis]